MGRYLDILLIFALTIGLGTLLAVLVSPDLPLEKFTISLGLQLSFLYSLPALAISLFAVFVLKTQAPIHFFRSMMRVLLGILVSTFLMLIAIGMMDLSLIRVYATYAAVAVALTFWRLKPRGERGKKD